MKDPLPWPNKPVDWNTRTGGYAKDMLLRDEFAKAAMQGFAAHPIGATKRGSETGAQANARLAYEYADAMLKAREA